MLTVHGVFKDGQITLLDQVPFTEQHTVLVTFLDTDDLVTIPREKRDSLLEHIRESGLGLSRRELQVLELTQQDMRYKEIADTLELGAGTVRNYLSSAYKKLKVRNKTEAIKKAVELGLLSPVEGF